MNVRLSTLPYLVYGIKVVGRGVPTEPSEYQSGAAHRDGSPYLGNGVMNLLFRLQNNSSFRTPRLCASVVNLSANYETELLKISADLLRNNSIFESNIHPVG